MSNPELADWYTEREAAAAIECSVRSVQRYIEARKIEVRKRPREGRKPENVLNPRDVDALRPAAHIMPEQNEEPKPAKGSGLISSNKTGGPASADAFFGFISAITTAIATTRRDDGIAAAPAKLWLSLDEAAEYSGLSRATLRNCIGMKELVGIRGGPNGAWRISRRSLEAFKG